MNKNYKKQKLNIDRKKMQWNKKEYYFATIISYHFI